MNALYRYILSVLCTVMICGVFQVLFPGDKHIIKFVTGLVVTVVVLSPLLHRQKLSINTFFDTYLSDGDFAVQEGISAAREVSMEFIKEKTEAYILNKAAEMGAQVSVDIGLSDSEVPIPTQITVSGMVSPFVKSKLSACIQHELGIAEDEQIWIS